MTIEQIQDGVPILRTRIPCQRRVEGLEYGGHVNRSGEGWEGYYVRPVGTEQYGVCRTTPASDEVYGTDEEIVSAIRDEL